ncbi:uncharacterized protein LOC121265722 [Juglans microcarpa x Juglans regia]|uniref:uncharacterized protein LOC121265722 n=1 Tax=Juglans microcarpa x Juglans regia TaxID=2249226 RepID=UPI001B7F6ED1|nr:uncharacterized protein LOC121265722 [Juglans microcarpa x Juglans regia]
MGQVDRNQSMFDAATQVRSLGGLDDLAMFFTIASSLWFRRNRKRDENEILDARTLIEHAMTTHRMFGEVRLHPVAGLKNFYGWQPPPMGFLKLNIDGAVFHHIHRARVGAILRDAQGKVILSASKGEWEVKHPEVIEFMAVLHGIQFIAHMGITHLVVELVCLLVVKVLEAAPEDQSPAHGLARYAWVVDPIAMWWGGFLDFISQAIWLDSCL